MIVSKLDRKQLSELMVTKLRMLYDIWPEDIEHISIDIGISVSKKRLLDWIEGWKERAGEFTIKMNKETAYNQIQSANTCWTTITRRKNE